MSLKTRNNLYPCPLPSYSAYIRLLTLPSALGPEGDIALDLRVFELEYAPPYLALSYTWGSPFPADHPSTVLYDGESSKSRVTVNSHRIHVGSSLHEALTELVRRYPSAYLWNDATCIDQGNAQELNSQIHVMAEIYRRAQEVIVWLGPADEDALMCRALYERLARPILQLSDDEELARRKPPAQVTDLDPGDARLWSLLRSAPLDPAKRSWQAYINFHRRSWFWRVWVVQEFAFAFRMTILCGHLTFPERYIRVLNNCLVFDSKYNWARAISASL